jgi:hypothetical protein
MTTDSTVFIPIAALIVILVGLVHGMYTVFREPRAAGAHKDETASQTKNT